MIFVFLQRQLRERHEQELVKEKERERFLLAMRYGKAFRGVISRSTEMQHRRQRKIVGGMWATHSR